MNISAALHDYCARSFVDKPGLKIHGLRDITSGWESQLYAFDLLSGSCWRRQRQALVLRLYQGEGAGEKASHEFRCMQQLAQAGYPVPQVFALEPRPELLGKPFVIMQRITGPTMWQLLEKAPPAQMQALIRQFCQLFVDLHRLDWQVFAGEQLRRDVQDPYYFVDSWLAYARRALAQLPDSGFWRVVEWLAARRSQLPCRQPAVLHWDFHPNNILIQPDGRAFVIDWPGCQVSDARFDLAWTLLLANSYVGPDLRNAILEEYQRLAGAALEGMEIFEVFASLRRLNDVLVSLSQGAEKMGMRAETADLIRQQLGPVRRVYEILVERTGIQIEEVSRLLTS